jgi:hypothetical protein
MFEVMAVNDESDTCSCCGKTRLKRVVWISEEGQDPSPFGTTCAAHALAGRVGRKPSAAKANKAIRDEARRKLERHAAEVVATSVPPEVEFSVNKWGVEVVQVGGVRRVVGRVVDRPTARDRADAQAAAVTDWYARQVLAHPLAEVAEAHNESAREWVRAAR